MTKRRCLDCPTLVEAGTRDGRCGPCRRRKDQARGTRQERGYDAEHDAERKRWAPMVAAGTVTCRRAPSGRCLAPHPLIGPDESWQLGHPDADCPAPRAPEHERCNLATATHRSNQTKGVGVPPSDMAERDRGGGLQEVRRVQNFSGR